MISVREEKTEDITSIRAINERAFGQPTEANIIDRLRGSCVDIISLVAVDGNKVVGHILFSPVVIESDHGVISGMGLAPMAVMPERQRQGIGFALVRKGLAIIRERGYPFVIVLGHSEYYPRFGFEPASKYGLLCQWEEVPDEAFMVIVFNRDEIENVHDIVYYKDEFNEAM